MALAFQGIGNSSPENPVGDLHDEKIVTFGLISTTPSAISLCGDNKAHNRCTELKPESQVLSKKGGSGGDNSGSNGGRSITDLPSVLVSEILYCLDPKDLAVVSCVSTLLNCLATDNRGWKDFYCKRWGPPLGSAVPSGSWKGLFVEREHRSRSFMGRFNLDALRGHTEPVRAVFLLQPAKLIITGGYDSVVRLWDMEEGLLVSSSRPIGCTIRAVSADSELLVVGGTKGFIQCWRAIDGHPLLFDVAGAASSQNTQSRLWGHEGPITCLALDSTRIFSGSWDMSVRVWDRAKLNCLKTLRHGDWVWALSPRGSTMVSTAGTNAYVWDVDNENMTAVIHNAHVGNAYSLARSHTGDLLFTGGEDGSIHLFEIANCNDDDDIKPSASWTPHTGPVHSLAFEFPWLVSSSGDGRIALINVRKLLGPSLRSLSRRHSVKQSSPSSVEPPQRMLHGFGSDLFSVAVSADRIVCGSEEGVVRVWDFSQALEIDNRIRALRGIRLENKMRRQKVQAEKNGRAVRADQSSTTSKRNQANGWQSKRSERKTKSKVGSSKHLIHSAVSK